METENGMLVIPWYNMICMFVLTKPNNYLDLFKFMDCYPHNSGLPEIQTWSKSDGVDNFFVMLIK